MFAFQLIKTHAGREFVLCDAAKLRRSPLNTRFFVQFIFNPKLSVFQCLQFAQNRN